MKKVLFLICAGLIMYSCSKEEDDNVVNNNNEIVVANGKLSDVITKDNIYNITSLTVNGTISGEDWKTLFEMATMGNLEMLDMTNARIVGVVDADYWNDDEIPEYEFSHSKTLKEVFLPKTLKVIGEEAFAKCSRLEAVHFSEGIDSIAPRAFYESALSGELNMPSQLRVIARQAFAYTKLTKVLVNSNIIAGKTITQKESPDGEISNYSSIYAVGGNSVFAYCESLSEVIVKEGCTFLEVGFEHCTSLSSLILPSSLQRIGQIHKIIDELENIYQSNDSLWYKVTNYSILTATASVYSGSNGNYIFKDCTGLKNIRLPEKLRFIGEKAFENTSLESMDIPNNVTYIWNGAFKGCTLLNTIKMPSQLKHIGSSSFQGCTSLNEILIPDNVFYVGSNAFADCTSVNTIYFGKNIKDIGISAFQQCSKLKSIDLPQELYYLGKSAFEGCSNLRTVILPDHFEEIETSTFKDCIELKDLIIGTSVTKIGSSAFLHCPKLETINLPSSISNIENYAFAYTGVKQMEVNWNTPLSITDNTFNGVNLSKATLRVPIGATETYRLSSVWKDFGLIIEKE